MFRPTDAVPTNPAWAVNVAVQVLPVGSVGSCTKFEAVPFTVVISLRVNPTGASLNLNVTTELLCETSRDVSANVTMTVGARVSTPIIGMAETLPALPATSDHAVLVNVTLAAATSLVGVNVAVNINGLSVAVRVPKTPDVVLNVGIAPGASLNVKVRCATLPMCSVEESLVIATVGGAVSTASCA